MGDGDLVTGLFETYQLFRPRWWQVWRWVEWFRIPKRHRITLTITDSINVTVEVK